MMKSYLNSEKMNRFLNFTLFTPGKLRLAIIVLVVTLFSNNLSAQTNASSTWALTSNATAVAVGAVSGSAASIGGGLSSATYSTNGLSASSWANDSRSLVADEYYEFIVTPTAAADIFNVTSIKFDISRSSGDWKVQAYFSTDNFTTSSSITSFSCNSSTPATKTNSVDINVANGENLSVRIYGWDSDGSGRAIRVKNMIISGTTCKAPSKPTITAGTTTFCSGESVTLTSSASSGNQWYKDNVAISGENSNTYSATTSGVYTVKASIGDCSSSVSTGTTVTVSPANTAGTASSTPTLCINTALTDITITTTGATGIGTATGLPAGVTAAWASNTITISGTPTASGTFDYSIPLTGGCGSVNATGTIEVVAAPSVAGTITGTATVCRSQSGVGYSVPAITNATSYTWAYTGTGATITNGTTRTPTIAFAANATSGNLTVYGVNACGNGTISSNYAITVKPLPIATITANYCAVPGKIQLTASGGDTYLWNTGQTVNPILVDLAGNYSVTATLGGCTSTPFALNVGQELVINGDFTAGNTGFTSGYNYNPDIAGNQELYNDTGNNGYAVGTNGQNYHTNFWGIDHTNNPTGSKNFMLVNGHGSTITIWQQTVNVQPNTDYYFSAWAMSLNNGGPYARLRFEVNGVQVGTTANLGTGPSNATEALANNYWTRFYSDPIWNSGSLNGPITIKIVNLESSADGNDFALDDISFGTLAALPFSIVAAGNTGNDSTLCTGETFNLFTNLTNGKDPITYSWTGPNGFTSTLANPSISNVTTANSGNYTLTVTDGYNCGSQTKSVNLTVSPLLISPTIGTTKHATCATPTKGSVVLDNLPSSGTWNLYQNGNATPIVTGGSGISITISDLAVGTYTFTVSNGSCESSPVSVTISPLVTNTFKNKSWSPNTPTDALHLDQNIVFEDDYNDNKNLYGCSCEVKSGNVVIHENYTLKVTNEVKVTGGSLTFLNTASLVQTNDVANTGNITYNRTTPTVRPTDYVYWSSPVSGQTIANFSPTVGSIKYYYDLGWKAPSDSDVMVKGLGYIIRGQVTSNDKYDASFVGVPNNGPVAIPANTAAKYYLVGNPYPSAIDADEFLDQNAGLDGNVYLWTHNTEIAKNAAGTEMVYTSDDYANYNFTGSTSTFKSEECKTCPNNAKPIGKIAAGQSFFVKTISATTIQFNNDMRLESKDKIDNSDQNSQFFRTTNTNTTKSKTAVVEKHRLWLNLTNNQGAFKQTLIGYVTGATNDLDARYDGQNFNGNAFINFYSINQNKNFTIQGRALPFDQNDEVALGFKSTMKGSFTIAIDEVDGLLANQAVFIEDKLKGTTFNLKTGNYTFDTEVGTFNERFVIRYTDKTLATEDFTIAQNTVLVSVKNKQVKVNAGETIDKVVVYDLLGRQIYTKTAVNSNELVVSNLVSGQQALVVKVVLQNGSSSTKKIVY